MPSKNPPITGAAQSVPNERVREMFKGRPEPAAPPANAERKNFRTSKPKAEVEEPEIDAVKESSAEPEKPEIDAEEEEGDN
jgi:hypothetical protein